MDRPTDGVTVEEILARLASPATTEDEAARLVADLDGREATAMPVVFQWLHDATDEPSLHVAVRVLAHWADRPAAAALPPALRALLDEPGTADHNKMAAAGLLAHLGEPVTDAELAAKLSDPAAVARAALRTMMDSSDNPLALVHALDGLAHLPRAIVLSLTHDLTLHGDRRAWRILVPLAHADDVEVAASAIAAIEALDLGEAAEALAEVATYHAAPEIRVQADLVIDRLSQASEAPLVSGGLYGAYLSAVDGDGGQLVVLARDSAVDAEALDVLTIYHDDVTGVREYATAELVAPDEFEGMLADLAAEDVLPFAVPPSAAAWQLDAATCRTLAAGGSEAVGYVAWPVVMGPTDREPPFADEDRGDADLADAPQLLDHPAFALWFFPSDEVLAAMPAPNAPPGQAIAGLVDDEDAQRLARRLRHQAWLLAGVGDGKAAALAVAAAVGLEPGSGIEPADHPLLVAMARRGLEMGEA